MKKLEIAKRYKVMLEGEYEQFIITGSTALEIYGISPISKDLDIILVNATTKAKQMLQNFQEAYPPKYKPYNSGKMYIIEDPIMKVDFFLVDTPTQHPLIYRDMMIDTIPHIIAEKKGANRFKDWAQLRHIARIFFKHEEFKTFMNNH